MEIINNLGNYSAKKPLALSIGMFDGVHRGHQSIIARLNEISAEKNWESAILTFWPHPRLVFNPDDDLKLLNIIDEKVSLLEQFGLKKTFIQQFNEDFRNLTGEDFVKEILAEKLNAKHLIIGHDHVFGKNRSGNFDLLRKMAPEFGFEVEEMKAVNSGADIISSTKIRSLISDGKIKEANGMLGYRYKISGEVVHGKKIGRTIGFPTANISVNPIKLLPKKGAYVTSTTVDGVIYKSMTSIGTNPTVGGQHLSLETYLLDFSGDLYGKQVSIVFYEFLHEEIRFENLEKLVQRLREDKILTEKYPFD